MIRKVLTVAVLVICGLTQSVSADEGTKEESVPQMVGTGGSAIIIIEGSIWLYAYMASQNPKLWGVVYAVGAPLVAMGSKGVNTTALWVGVASVETLAFYNIRLDENKMSKSEIIRANFIGWNAVMVVIGLTEYFTGDFDKDKKIALNYMPEPQGGRLILSYRF